VPPRLGFNGVYDLTTDGMRSAGLVERFVGSPSEEAPGLYRAASPVEQVDGDDPPALLLHGTADRIVPYEQAVGFEAALTDAGVGASRYTADGAGHGFHNEDPWLSRTTQRVGEFLDARL
jgi:acetyl esterase/lipase